MNSAHERNSEAACQAWWLQKDLFLPTFPYERIAWPSLMYSSATNFKSRWRVMARHKSVFLGRLVYFPSESGSLVTQKLKKKKKVERGCSKWRLGEKTLFRDWHKQNLTETLARTGDHEVVLQFFKKNNKTENAKNGAKESVQERMGERKGEGRWKRGRNRGSEGLGFLWLCVWAAPHVPH